MNWLICLAERKDFKTVECRPVLRKQLSLLKWSVLLKTNFSEGVVRAKSHFLVMSSCKDPGLFERRKPKPKEFPAPQKQLPRNMFPRGSTQKLMHPRGPGSLHSWRPAWQDHIYRTGVEGMEDVRLRESWWKAEARQCVSGSESLQRGPERSLYEGGSDSKG